MIGTDKYHLKCIDVFGSCRNDVCALCVIRAEFVRKAATILSCYVTRHIS